MSGDDSSLSGLAVRGVAWRSALSAAGKVASFLGQWALGYLLEPEAFGIYAFALSISGTLGALQDAGVEKYLLQDPKKFASRAPACLLLSRMTAWGSGLCIGLVALFFAVSRNDWHTLWVTLPFALAAPIGASRPVLRADLDGAFRFREAATVALVSNIARVVLTIAFSAWGLGALSLSLPWCLVAVLELVLLRHYSRGLPQAGDRHAIGSIFKASRWIMTARFLVGVINQGDYLVLALFWSSSLLGSYYFGYSLMGSLTLLLGIGMKDVILPILSRLKDEPERRAEFYYRGTRAIVVLSAPVFVGAACLAEPTLSLLWGDKWLSSVPAVQAFAISSAFLILSPVANAALETLGRWRQGALMVGLHALLTVLAASAASFSNDLSFVVRLAVGQHALSILIQLTVAGLALRASVPRLLASVAGPMVLCLPGWLAAEKLSEGMSGGPVLWALVLRAAVFTGVTLPLLLLFYRHVALEVLAALKRR